MYNIIPDIFIEAFSERLKERETSKILPNKDPCSRGSISFKCLIVTKFVFDNEISVYDSGIYFWHLHMNWDNMYQSFGSTCYFVI